jgi:hypothetical protein
MRGVGVLALVIVIALVVAGLVAITSGSAGGSSTSIRVSYWEDGSLGAPDTSWTLRCNPARGTLPRPSRACTKLDAGGADLFAPIPPNAICTEIYGGPQRARIVGSVGGKRVWATLERTNGCHISRWERLSPWLLPPGGVTR